MAKFYLTFGYPLSVSASSSVEGYIVELCPGEMQILSNKESLLWANLLSCGSSEDTEGIEILAGRGLLIAGNTKAELLDQCLKCYPIRQGIGSTMIKKSPSGNKEQYFSVRLGDNNFTLMDFQRLFWYYSTGSLNVSEIIESLSKENCSINISDKSEQIFTLIKFGLLFLRK